MSSAYRVTAAIDVHKRWLYVVVGEPEAAEQEFFRYRSGSTSQELAVLARRLHDLGVTTIVMESTAQYWKPVWAALEGQFSLLLAQARSNAAPQGRKSDYADATRLMKRLWADDLRLSFVPEAEQRGWRLLARARLQHTREITRLRNQIEGLLEECRIKISGLLSDLLGASGRRMLRALIAGTINDPHQLAELADKRLRATPEELERALAGQLGTVHRLLLGQLLDQIQQLEDHIAKLDQCLLDQLADQRDVIRRLCAIPGIGIEAAQVIVSELGPRAATFATASDAASWIGVCPGRNESAGYSTSDASPKGNRQMRRILNQCAWAAVRSKDTYWQHLFRKFTPRLGVNKAVWAVAHRLLRVIWLVLHEGVEYQERGPCPQDPERLRRRIERALYELRKRGVHYQLTAVTPIA